MRMQLLHCMEKVIKLELFPISKELAMLINKYLKDSYINYGDDYLFYSNQKKKYSRFGINYIINQLVKKLHLIYPNYFNGNYHPHSIRHTKATHLYNNSTPLLYIKDFLGHSTITSTEIYATPDMKKRKTRNLKKCSRIRCEK